MNSKLLLRRIGSEVLYRSKALQLAARYGQAWRILMYHRVTDPMREGYPLQAGMYVAPESFAKHLSYLRKECEVIDLDTLVVKILNKEHIPRRTVALSFDDGWLDNYEHAFPLLKEHKLPASIFLATEYIGSKQTFWSDALPYAIAHLRENASKHTKRIKDLAEINEIPSPQLALLQQCITCPAAMLDATLESVITSYKNLPRDSREGFAAALLQEAGGKPKASFMTWEQVREMSRHDISFGSHTHRHIPLDELDTNAITLELNESKEMLLAQQANIAGVFCYPEGRYSNTSQAALTNLGIGASLSTDKTTILTTTPPLIGRVGIHNDITTTTAQFATRLWL